MTASSERFVPHLSVPLYYHGEVCAAAAIPRD